MEISLEAIIKLVERLGGEVVRICCLIDLPELGGKDKYKDYVEYIDTKASARTIFLSALITGEGLCRAFTIPIIAKVTFVKVYAAIEIIIIS